jgi:hypothetical protein
LKSWIPLPSQSDHGRAQIAWGAWVMAAKELFKQDDACRRLDVLESLPEADLR